MVKCLLSGIVFLVSFILPIFADNTSAEVVFDSAVFNPFTLTAGYSEQDHREHAYDLVNQASTLVINGQGDLDVSGAAAFVGTQVSGPGRLHLKADGGIREESVADVHEASSHTSGFSISANLGELATGNVAGAVLSAATGTGGQNSRTYDYDSYVDQGAAGIQMGGGQTLDGPVTVIEPPTVSIHREESCIPLSLLRLGAAGYKATQAVQDLMQTLSPPAERFQSELYMALDEEGVSPTESAQIIEDPVLQKAIKDIDEAAAEIKQVAKTQRQVEAVSAGTSSHPVSDAPVDVMDLGLNVPDVPGMAKYLATLRDPVPQQTILQRALVKVSSGIQTVRRSAVEFGETHPRLVSALEVCADYGIQVARFGFYVGSGLAGGATGTFVMGPGPGTTVGVTMGLTRARATEEQYVGWLRRLLMRWGV